MAEQERSRSVAARSANTTRERPPLAARVKPSNLEESHEHMQVLGVRCVIVVLLLPNVAASADAAMEALTRGAARLEKKDYDAAIAALNEVIRLNPTTAEAYCGRGQAYENKGEHNKAIADCTEAIPAQSETARGVWQPGHCLLGDQGRIEIRRFLTAPRPSG